MKKNKHLFTTLLAFSIGVSASTAFAQMENRFYFTTGLLHVAPQVKSDPLFIKSVDGHPINQTIPNTGSSLDEADTLGFSLGYFITDHISTDMVIGIPPKFNLSGTKSLAALGVLGSTKEWSPTLLFKYHFNQPTVRLRPYIGLGVTYIWFADANITNPAFLHTLGGPTSVSISRTWAPVFNVGFNYNFSKRWFTGVSLSYIPAKITATLNSQTAQGSRVSEVNLRLDPIVAYIDIGYRF